MRNHPANTAGLVEGVYGYAGGLSDLELARSSLRFSIPNAVNAVVDMLLSRSWMARQPSSGIHVGGDVLQQRLILAQHPGHA